ANVGCREAQHHEERWQDKCHTYRRCSEHAGANVAEIDGELSGEWAGSELCECQTLNVVFFANPAALVDEVLLHMAGESDRSAEADRSQSQEISNELDKRHFRCVGRWHFGLHHDIAGPAAAVPQ